MPPSTWKTVGSLGTVGLSFVLAIVIRTARVLIHRNAY